MNTLEGFRSHMSLKEMLQVKIKPMQNHIKASKEKDLVIPVMIDIRTYHEKSSLNQHSQKQIDDESANSCTPTSQASINMPEIDRQPLDLIFVIDLSISMRGKKMNQLKRTISNMMSFLNESDRMAIIGFNNSAQNLFPLAHLTQQNKKRIAQILSNILPMGLTNITVGLMEGLKQLEASLIDFSVVAESCEGEEDDKLDIKPSKKLEMQSEKSEQYRDMLSKSEMLNDQIQADQELTNSCITFGQKKQQRVKSIFLLSDGLDDRCENNLQQLYARIQQVPIQFSLNTFGYGEQHDAYLMNEIAKFKEGNFYYIEDIEKTDLYFADALGGLFSVVGNSLEFDFTLNSENQLKNMTISKVYGDMWTQIQSGQTCIMPESSQGKVSSINQLNKGNMNQGSPTKLAKNMLDQIHSNNSHSEQQTTRDQYANNYFNLTSCNRINSNNNSTAHNQNNNNEQKQPNQPNNSHNLSNSTHSINQQLNSDKKLNSVTSTCLSSSAAESIVKTRSFNLNQIFFGVSKQILLEITIPHSSQLPSIQDFSIQHQEQSDQPGDIEEKKSECENEVENQEKYKQFSQCLKNQIIGVGQLKVKDLHGAVVEITSHLEVVILDDNEEIQSENDHINEDVEINYLRVQCAQALQDAMNSALKNDYNESQNIISKALELIQKSKPQIQKRLTNLQKDLQDCIEALKQKISLQQSSNPNSQSQLSFSSSHSTQDQKEYEQEKAHNIRRAFLCKSRAYMEQKSVMINLDEYQNNIQKNIKKQIEIQNQKKVFSAEEEEKEKDSEKPVRAKKILIPMQRKKFSSMNVGIEEISSIDEKK